MSAVDLGKFSCDACQRQYPWKPEYAGRKVKCKCGQVLTAPTEAPNPPAQQDDPDDLLGGLYDLAAQEQQASQNQTVDAGLRCPSCHADMLVGETVCPNCNFNLKTGLKERAQKATSAMAGKKTGSPMLGYAGTTRQRPGQAQADAANAIGGAAMTELYIPAGLVLLGLLAQVFLYGFDAGSWRGVGYALPGLSVGLVANLVLCFAGCLVAASVCSISFGSPGPAALKLTAICLLPPAIGQIIGNAIGYDSMMVRHAVPSLIMLPIILGLFCWLFQMEFADARITTFIIWLVNKFAVVGIVALVLTGAIAGSSLPTPSRETVKADEWAQEALTWQAATESRAWLSETQNHLFASLTHASSGDLVDGLYTAGAKRCTTLSHSGEGYALIVELPTKSAARQKVITFIDQRESAAGTPPSEQTKDEGQKFHTFRFAPIPTF